jgi:hypothetical protein
VSYDDFDDVAPADVLDGLISADDWDAMHYGILRKSGRYPWGSGSTANVRNRQFLDYFDKVRADGEMTVTQACQMLGISTTDYRAARSAAKNQQKQVQIRTAQKLRDKGWSHEQIANKMFGSKTKESTVRSLLKEDTRQKADALHNIANMLEEGVLAKKYIDIGSGVEQHLGISPDRLRVAVAMLKEKGYMVHPIQVEQLGTAPGNKTTVKVLAPPGSTYREVSENKTQIQQLDALGKFSKDNGKSILGIAPPLSISKRRIGVNYSEDGGRLADGVIYVRPGVKDISLGSSHYAQVRVMVDGTHFLKGMAVYKDDLPPGVDLVFNTSKSKTDLGSDKLAAFKPLKTKLDDNGKEVIDVDNPFGAQLKPGGQILDPKTGKATSAMNILNEEGDWGTWSKNLSSQFLSKQSSILAKRQLDQTYDERRADLDEIMNLTNPAVRKKLLESFADGADSDATDLKAAAISGQASHVILPVEKMKDTEVYAPNFQHGSKVVLVRYPHGGTFEIPELTVNNRQKDAKAAFGEHPPDAIGINPKVAQKLSGADFDGDSVIVIPQRQGPTKIQTQDSLKELATFDPQREYPHYEGMKVMSEPRKQQEMGKISNLITDMTIKGASNDKLARAVKHSMVVIDAAKHKLDWQQSEIDNGIKALRAEFQAKPDDGTPGGSATLISRAGSPVFIRAKRPRPASQGGPVDPKTGKKVFVPKGESFIDPKTGKERFPKEKSTKLAEANTSEEVFGLTSGGSKRSPGTRVEAVYADHSLRMKELANLARKEAVNTKFDKADPAAARTFAAEVASLNAKLSQAIANRPLERQAQVYANETVASKKADYPNMDDAQLKKIRFQALAQARERTGAERTQVEITPQEWQAIQARAISPSKLVNILDNTDIDNVRSLATPRQTLLMGGSNLSRARTLIANGHTQAEVAQQLGVSLTTLKNSLKGG